MTFAKNHYGISDLGLTLPRFESLGLYLDMTEGFCTKNEDFDQTYLNTGSKTQNVEELSLDLIFHNKFW